MDDSRGQTGPVTDAGQDAGDARFVCAVAIARDESAFIDEWLAYHRLLGVDHFFLYDDDPATPLKHLLNPHGKIVTVIDWFGRSGGVAGVDRRLRAYDDAIARFIAPYRWAAFLDIDEFIVLRQHTKLAAFLTEMEPYDQVSLNRHVFGHNGQFGDPRGLVTAKLTRRMRKPVRRFRSIVRPAAIEAVTSAYSCQLRPGHVHVDPNGQPFTPSAYHDKTRTAHINHYVCRSFQRWMDRPKRGSVVDDDQENHPECNWQHNEAECLRQFVRAIAKDRNEHVDDFMVRYRQPIRDYLKQHGIGGSRLTRTTSLPLRGTLASSSISNDAMVVYTAVTAGYDMLQQQETDGVDFVAYLSDPRPCPPWELRQLESWSADANRNAKIYKVLAHRYFPGRMFSLWIDGNIKLNVPPRSLIEMYMADYDLVVHRHPDRDCAYAEAAACKRRRLDDPQIIDDQMRRYRREAYPSSIGLHENRVILRRHNDRVRAFNELWWDEIQNGSKRDQLSSAYVARRVGLKVGYFPGSMRDGRSDYNGLFSTVPHMVPRQRVPRQSVRSGSPQ